eukprot:CAMPEP_0197662640 /NCGR_PEP_ID=MMETSP1338-20131121/54207_1 /TAXON_ID=43686 ORGANISM="Pelagodinium beii, Strain RCC1491" /NCGR_SAMPLE_ID=MMETSP1338 /ASSEMBLY_ACC=CAM_ASM_000754 /LENGTH=81 /DNA_ID=CAMNT_0043240575 /DNA_START=45 /DNA_END=290 /DNA_ORIENTATION=-
MDGHSVSLTVRYVELISALIGTDVAKSAQELDQLETSSTLSSANSSPVSSPDFTHAHQPVWSRDVSGASTMSLLPENETGE